MQGKFPKDEQEIKAFRHTIGDARFGRYLNAASGEEAQAVSLYVWNAQVSSAFYLPLQIWEVALRNQMNRFLCWKFSDGGWPYNDVKAVRQFNGRDRERLSEARRRQEEARNVKRATTDAIVADLSAGFWVSMLSGGYDAKFAWRYNLPRVFPHGLAGWKSGNPSRWDPLAAHAACERLLNLRNRIAHHEPVYELALPQLEKDVYTIVSAMCPASSAYLASSSSIAKVLAMRPSPNDQHE